LKNIVKRIYKKFDKSAKLRVLSSVLLCFIALLMAVSVFGVLGGGETPTGGTVSGGSAVVCSDFVQTADGKQFCNDDEKVYDCSSVNVLTSGEECKGAVEHEISVDSFFGSVNVPDGSGIAEAYHYMNPKMIYDAPAKVYYTIINKDSRNGVKGVIVEKKVSYQVPVFGVKQVCNFNEVNQSDDCWEETDTSRIFSYETRYGWENNDSDKSVLLIDAFEQPEIRATFVLEYPTTQRTYHIDVIPHIEFENPATKEEQIFSQTEWVDITPTSDSLQIWLKFDNDWIDSANGSNQGGAMTFVPWDSGATIVDGLCKSNQCFSSNFSAIMGGDVNHEYLLSNSPFAFCSWYMATSGDGQYLQPWGYSKSSTGERTLELDIASTDQNLNRIGLWNGGARTDAIYNISAYPFKTQWKYLCIVYNGVGAEWYFDGVESGPTTPATQAYTQQTNYTFLVGSGDAGGIYNQKHYLDEWTFWNTTLTKEDIVALYENNGIPFVPNTAPTITEGPTLTPSPAPDDFDISCTFKPLDDDEYGPETLTATVHWYKDGAINLTNDMTVYNDTEAQFVLASENTTINDIWFCNISVSDGIYSSDWVNSSETTIVSAAGNWTDFTTPTLQSNFTKAVFVYDASKENWNRSGNPDDPSVSWWNEKGNFPSKVYLFLTDKGLDIIDASNNNLWMSFTNGSNNAIESNSDFTSVYALDGKIYVGSDKGMYILDFANDNISKYNTNGLAYYNNQDPFLYINRNGGKGYTTPEGTGLASDVVNDVHANKVKGKHLVAMATDGGVNKIDLSDGSVAQLIFVGVQGNFDSDNVFIADDGTLYYSENNINPTLDNHRLSYKYSIENYNASNGVADGSYLSKGSTGSVTYPHFPRNAKINDVYVTSYTSRMHFYHNTIYVATEKGLSVIQEVQGNEGVGTSKLYGYTGTTNTDIDYKVLEGATDNVTSVTARSDGNAMYVGTNSGTNGGSVSKISLNSNSLLTTWNTTSDPAIVGNDVTGLDFLDGDLLVGTLSNGATQLVEQELDHYLIADYTKHRVVEIDSNGLIHFEFGVYNSPGSDSTHLNNPTDAERLTNGNTLIADYGNKRILEVDPDKTVVREIGNATQLSDATYLDGVYSVKKV
jgi:hypothetical protein